MGDISIVQCVLAYDLSTRERLWAAEVGPTHKDGPRGTPTVDDGFVYAIGTSGDHQVLGRMMRRHAAMIKLDQADVAYSVSDGAPWIRRQYGCQLPMLKANILDYYHLRDHVIKAACVVFGEGTAQGGGLGAGFVDAETRGQGRARTEGQ